MATYGYLTSPILITVLGVFESCAQAVAIPGGYAAVATVFPDDWAATGQGWYSAAGTAAAGVSSVAGAPAYAAVGSGPVFAGGALLSAAFVGGSVVTAQWGRARRAGQRDGDAPASAEDPQRC
jgi:hypothetical protein